MEDKANTIHPSEPAAKKRGRPPKSKARRVEPADLMPESIKSPPPSAFAYYWVGVINECPIEFPSVAGISFPKHTQKIEFDPKQQRKVRTPRTGAVTKLDRRQFERLLSRIRQTVIRFYPTPKAKDPDADAPETPTRAHLISIPTKEAMEEQRKAGYAVNNYVPSPNDRPASEFFYCIPCEDQSAPEPGGNYYPEPMSKTGLVWPLED